MAVKKFDIARHFSTDELLAKFQELQKSAKTTDAMLQVIGEQNNLDTFIASLKQIEELITKIQKSDSSQMSGLGDALKQIFDVNFSEPTQQLGKFLDQIHTTFKELQSIDITKNTKDMKTKLSGIVSTYQDALKTIGVKSDFKIDMNLDISEIFAQTTKEFQKLNELKLNFGDIAQIAASGQVAEGAIEDAGKKVAKKIKQQTSDQVDALAKSKKELIKAYKDYYNAVIDEGFDAETQEPTEKMLQIQDRIDDILSGLKLDKKVQLGLNDIIPDIEDGSLDVDDIAATVNKLFKGVQVEAIKTEQAIEDAINVETSSSQVVETLKEEKELLQDISEIEDKTKSTPTDIVDSAELTEAKKQVQELQQSLDELQSSYKKLQIENEILVEAQKDANEQLYDTQQEANKLTDALSTEKNNLSEELVEAKKHAEELEQSFNNLNEEYLKSQGANDALKTENAELTKQLTEAQDAAKQYGSQMETLTGDLDEAAQKLQQTNAELINTQQKLEQFENAAGTTSAIDAEIAGLDRLKAKLEEVKQTVLEKTQAFETEKTSVDQSIVAEIASLQGLIDQLNKVKQAVKEKSDAFKSEQLVVDNAANQAKTDDKSLDADKWKQHQDNLLEAATAEELKKESAQELYKALFQELSMLDRLNTAFKTDHVNAVLDAAAAEDTKKTVAEQLVVQLKQELTTVRKLVTAWENYNKAASGSQGNPSNGNPPAPGNPQPTPGNPSSPPTPTHPARQVVSLTGLEFPELIGDNGQDVLDVLTAFKSDLHKHFNDADQINIIDTVFGDEGQLESTTVALQHLNKEANTTVTQLYKIAQSENGDWTASLVGQTARSGNVKKAKFSIQESLQMARSDLEKFKIETQDLNNLNLTRLESAFNGLQQSIDLDHLERFTVELAIARKEAGKLRAQQKASANTSKGKANTATLNADSLKQEIQQYVKQLGSNLSIDDTLFSGVVKELDSANQKLKDAMSLNFQKQHNLSDDEYNSYLDGLVKEVEVASKKVNDQFKQAFKIDLSQNELFKGNIDLSNLESELKRCAAAFVEQEDAYNGNTIAAQKFDKVSGTLNFSIRDQSGALHEYVVAADTAGQAVKILSHNVKASEKDLDDITTGWKGLTKSLLESSGQLLDAFVGGISIHELGQQICNGIDDVRELDLALTELKKVTDETDATYDKFLETASKTAGKIGSTITDFTNATADFARLGYSIDDASTLAESATVLLNVSEFDNIDQASSALISTMQAFKDDSKTTEELSVEIIDILNNIGKYILPKLYSNM